jgi:hypothetical protein
MDGTVVIPALGLLYYVILFDGGLTRSSAAVDVLHVFLLIRALWLKFR